MSLRVEVVYAEAELQRLVSVELAPGATVTDAIAAAMDLPEFDGLIVSGLRLGIFGKFVEPKTPVTDGDRVEIYRPLKIDPMQARRRRALAKAKKTSP
jgi:putative ubiquitin-RnfH superfamily antitoxin RatB of RatAB toxin-antitoxin module